MSDVPVSPALPAEPAGPAGPAPPPAPSAPAPPAAAAVRAEVPAAVRRRMLLRSFIVQGSWNYQSLIGTGLAFVLAPALRRVYTDPEALRRALARHAELFNSHPYLATVAAGAVARLEADGVPPETVARFKSALRGSLGALGDRLVWLMWRPASLMLGLALVLAGLPWWTAVAAFLLAFNALHLYLRGWGLRAGLEQGLEVGRVLRAFPFQRLGDRAASAGAAFAGAAAVLAIGNTVPNVPGWPGWVIGAAAAALGVALGRRVRAVAAAALLAVLLAGLVLARP
ncbi:MAG TPA: PTS system mannose/fructose/sorbose family transporter subunit IID [Longimicrobium sp.]|jgi:PTS system mannose-specific IID component